MTRLLRGIILLCVLLAVLFGIQVFVFFSIETFFSITDDFERLLLYAGTAAIPLGFILASIFGKMHENVITKSFYVLTGILLGIGANIALASLIVWGIFWIFGSSVYFSFPMLAGILFALAIIASIYGVWNASHPVIKHIEVSIPNLPDIWKGKCVVQLSDIHLGYVYQLNFMRRVVALVNDLHPEAVFITGDLFDGMDGDLEHAVDTIGDIRSQQGIFFVNGNHETYFGLEKSFDLLKRTPVRILKDEVVDVQGLKVIGIGYPKQGEKKDIVRIAESLSSAWKGMPNVLLYHAPTHIQGFQDAGINLQLSGHTHKGQLFPFNLITKIVHKGHDYGLYTQGDYTLYTTSGIGTWGPSMRLGNRPEIVAITLR